MLQTQTTPLSIYELDIDLFRAQLNNLSDNEDGMTFPTTHQHVAPVSVGGVQLARVIEIINDYTITFEDGQYAVNLVGANSNIGDRVNVNQVSVRSANSAGLPNLDVLETSAFRGGVNIDEANGRAGTQYPMGTSKFPVNNIADARTIAATHGINTIFVIGDLTVGNGEDISDMILIGQSPLQSEITMELGSIVDRAEFTEFTIQGAIDGEVVIEKCQIGNVSYSQGIMRDSLIEGTIQLGVAGQINFLDCASGTSGEVLPCIDINGVDNTGDCTLIFRNYSGGIKLTEKTGTGKVAIDVSSGKLVIDETCTQGSILARGDAKVINHNGDLMNSGYHNGDLLLTNETYFGLQVSQALGDGVHMDFTNGESGTNFPQGSAEFPVNNVADAMIIANNHSIDKILFSGIVNIAAGEDISGKTFRGYHAGTSILTMDDGCITDHTQFENCRLSGYQNGAVFYREVSVLGDIHNFAGYMYLSTIGADIHVAESALVPSQILDCFSASKSHDVADTNALDFGDGASTLIVRGWTGGMEVRNMDTVGTVLDMTTRESSVYIDSTCTEGSININKVGGSHEDNSGENCTVNLNSVAKSVWDRDAYDWESQTSAGAALLFAIEQGDPQNVADAVWDANISDHQISGTFGEYVSKKLLTIGKWIGLR